VDVYVFLKILTQLITPLPLMALGLVAGAVFVLLGFRRFGRFVATMGVAQALLLSLMPVADMLMVPLENEARRMAAQAPPCCYDAIVVLGGAVMPARPPSRPDPDLTDSSDRVWYAARLYKQNIAPRIILSGGGWDTGPGSEAVAMRAFLLDLGVPSDRIVLEARSRNTVDNIREVRAVVGDASVALVTSGYHMPRAMRIARAGKLNAQAFPTDWRADPGAHTPWALVLPSVDGMAQSWLAIKEHLAISLDFREGN
jgi:uncharacterized SAM-binding protein YcdF (DUF218 family)